MCKYGYAFITKKEEKLQLKGKRYSEKIKCHKAYTNMKWKGEETEREQ